MTRLAGKHALVTGGSNGIGAAIVAAYAREGARVAFSYRSDDPAAESVTRAAVEAGGQVVALRHDGGDADAADTLLEWALAALGRIDVLVNNAAAFTRTPFLEVRPEEYDRMLAVNLRFPFFLTQAVARQMREGGVRGSIINVSSVSAFRAVSRMSVYQCSKAGLSMLTKGAAYELAPFGIRVNTISPGLTATKSNRPQWRDDPAVWRSRAEGIPLGRPGVPDDHAGAAIFLASDESAWITGADLVVDGGHAVI